MNTMTAIRELLDMNTHGLNVMVGGKLDDWGIIPSFLDGDDDRSVIEQFNEHYMGGWQPFEGFTFDRETLALSYPGDPPYEPVSALKWGDENIILYPHGWVLVLQPDGTWQICRMD